MEDTKNEYVKHCCDLIAVSLAKRFLELKQECGIGRLKEFQKRLSLISKWTSLELKKEVDNILNDIQCDYLHQLVKEIITLNIKIKIADYKDSINKIKVKIPSIQDFFHVCFVKCAENYWKNPHLFYENLKDVEKQQCINAIEKLARTSVINALRSFTPIQEIMKQISIVSQNGLTNINDTDVEIAKGDDDEQEDVEDADDDEQEDVGDDDVEEEEDVEDADDDVEEQEGDVEEQEGDVTVMKENRDDDAGDEVVDDDEILDNEDEGDETTSENQVVNAEEDEIYNRDEVDDDEGDEEDVALTGDGEEDVEVDEDDVEIREVIINDRFF